MVGLEDVSVRVWARVCVCVWVTAGSLSSVFSIINPSEDNQKGLPSVPDALSFKSPVSFPHKQGGKLLQNL